MMSSPTLLKDLGDAADGEISDEERRAALEVRARRWVKLRKQLVWLAGGLSILAQTISIAGVLVLGWNPLAAVISIPATLFVVGYASLWPAVGGMRAQRLLEIEAEKERIERRLGGVESSGSDGQAAGSTAQGGAGYFNELVSINVTNLREYYHMVKTHAQQSFLASVFAGLFGFVLIAVGLGVAFFQERSDQSAAFLATGAGMLTEFISGVFFYLYNRTIRQLKDYHDSLLDVQNVLLTFKVLEDSVPEARPEMLEDIVAYLLGGRGNERLIQDARTPVT